MPNLNLRIMKFNVKSLSTCLPRLGAIQDVGVCPNELIETPHAMLYTRGGSIPHITNEVFNIVCKGPHILQIPLATTYNFIEAVSEFDGNISQFVGMKKSLSCITVQDPGDLIQSGHHCLDYMPLWTRNGKVMINANMYMNAIEAYRPDIYYLLADNDTNVASAAKRANKAVNNTINYYKECLERHKGSENLKNSFVMAVVTGGYYTKERLRCLEAVTKEDIVGGYLIDGLHNNGSEVEFTKFDEIEAIIKVVIENLPKDKMRVIHGCWNPVTVVNLVQSGVDLFDTSYCHIVTERSSALTFSFDLQDEKIGSYEINLRESGYAEDFEPILQGCTCLSCAKYTRGYIHHLLRVQELLGPLLLTIHNIHHYLKFFEKIRECIKEGTLDHLKNRISRQFDDHTENSKKTLVVPEPVLHNMLEGEISS